AEGKPLFLLGHSLGGLIAARFVQRYPHRHELSGLILSSPLVQLKLQVPGWKISLAGMLNQVWPTLRLPNEIAPDMVSRHEAIRATYR
ncbi:alpha/beta hydrolase, partial [Microbacteriaceae bacterium K1510]|nr:alpha/beta hydrolase [Microbacteriaceae bacterium K1510]